MGIPGTADEGWSAYGFACICFRSSYAATGADSEALPDSNAASSVVSKSLSPSSFWFPVRSTPEIIAARRLFCTSSMRRQPTMQRRNCRLRALSPTAVLIWYRGPRRALWQPPSALDPFWNSARTLRGKRQRVYPSSTNVSRAFWRTMPSLLPS
jgi:hypothetical protein